MWIIDFNYDLDLNYDLDFNYDFDLCCTPRPRPLGGFQGAGSGGTPAPPQPLLSSSLAAGSGHTCLQQQPSTAEQQQSDSRATAEQQQSNSRATAEQQQYTT